MVSLRSVLAGTKEVIELEIEALGGEKISVRKLSINEVNDIESIEAKAYGTFSTTQKSNARGRRQEKGSVESNAKVNLEKMNIASNQAKLRTVALACSIPGEEPYTEKEIGEYDNKVIQELYEKIREMNDMGNTADVEEDIDEFLE